MLSKTLTPYPTAREVPVTVEISNQNFDKFYYSHCCGANYTRTDEWLQFFRYIADRVIAITAPTRVLDAGCAKGFLVEAFREKGVEAFGVDISEYAIGEAHESIQPFVKVQSLTERIESKFDLIISIEVLEHMPQKDAINAIAQICSATDDVIFSSSPFDYDEPTHINVHPPEYWAREFARHGFFRDLDFDGSFLTPWATRYRRQDSGPRQLDELVGAYERKLWELTQAEQGSRKHAMTVQGQLAELKDILDEENSGDKTVTEHIANLKNMKLQFNEAKVEKERIAQQFENLLREYNDFWDSRSGALVRLLRGGRKVMIKNR